MKIFIGSSAEVANNSDPEKKTMHKIASTLRGRGVEPILWNKKPSVFRANIGIFESLTELIDEQEIKAAIFIFSKEDETWIRGEKKGVVRDNVLFEYGLFTGMLGRTRVIAVKADDVEVPSDLYGVKTINYCEDPEGADLDIINWVNNLPAQIKKQNPEITSIIGEFKKVIEEAKTKVFTEYISGENEAFKALTKAIDGAKTSVRSTRFSGFTVAKTQPEYFQAILNATNRNVNFHRIMTVNSIDKLGEISKLLTNNVGKNFTLYLTDIEYGFEMVIIDRREVFIHFRKDDETDKLITSTLHIEEVLVAKEFAKIFDDLSKKQRIEIFECKNFTHRAATEATIKIFEIFGNYCNPKSKDEQK